MNKKILTVGLLLVILVSKTVSGVCVREGEVNNDTDWMDAVMSQRFEVGSVVEFSFNATYSYKESISHPAQIVIHANYVSCALLDKFGIKLQSPLGMPNKCSDKF